MASYADVSLPVAVDKSFTYLIPPEIQSSAQIGSRALVPFGRKYITGLIVGLPLSSPLASLKPIKDIIDPSPVVSDELLKLCRWIADYYIAPLGEVLKAAIPHGFSPSSKRVAQAILPESELNRIIIALESRSKNKARVLKMIGDGGQVLFRDLQRKTRIRNIHALLNDLEREGTIRTEEVLPRTKQSGRVRQVVLLQSLDTETMERYLEGLSRRKTKVRKLISVALNLKQSGLSDIPAADLLKEAGATSSAIKELVSAGVLSTERREISRQQEYGTEQQTLRISLNEDQRSVLVQLSTALDARTHKTFLLHGVTGSGKTQVYIEAIRQCLASGKSAIVLVPEISLTPQIVRRFKSHFADVVAVVHSQMSAGERHDVWRLARRGECKVVIGPRSAIFAPLENLGLVIVDEEHEASYKQFDAMPRYHARDVAIVRGSNTQSVVVLGSATPSIESYFNARAGKYQLLSMPNRIDQVPMPAIQIVDMTGERKKEFAELKLSLPEDQRSKLKDFQQSPIASLLKEKIAERLERKEGIILLQNRRGFAPFVECMDCGYAESCDNCHVTLTYHLTRKHLRCHYCGLVRQPHDSCPQCKGVHIQLKGIGTQRVETELERLFPAARVLRMDLDTTTRKGAHDRILKKFGNNEADILLGTQMVAKGLDFPHVTLVGVISADTQMLLPDFRASERTFQLLTQVSGRAGRSTLRGEVVIQTHQPNHYTLQHVVDHDYGRYYEEELEARRELDYPPFARIVLVETRGSSESAVRQQAEQFAAILKRNNGFVSVLGPSPAVIGKINNQYRWHLVLKSRKVEDPSGSHLRHLVRRAHQSLMQSRSRNVRLIVDVDPMGLL